MKEGNNYPIEYLPFHHGINVRIIDFLQITTWGKFSPSSTENTKTGLRLISHAIA
jgi:hypothetical protein